MQTWTNLARLALIGTEHQLPTQSTLGDVALDEVLAKLGSVEERESCLLKTGAALTLVQRSGYKLGNSIPAISAAASESQPRCPEAAGQDLARMLRDYFPQVLPEWLELACSFHYRVPEELLPELFDHVKVKSELRTEMREVLGQRGAWLAAQNDDWSFAIRTGGDEKAWQEGKRAERLATLREIRHANPAHARELLAATWKDDAPEDRVEFIQELQTGLSIEDESFLETALDDKRKEVRSNAVRLLSSLPESKLVQSLIRFATPLLQVKKQLLRGPALEVTLPTECTKEMKRYGVGLSSNPSKDVGEKALWLRDMLEIIPPGHWTQSLGLTPKELIQAALKSDWAKVLLTGWATALGRHRNLIWVEAWMEAAVGHQELLDYLPPAAVSHFSGPELENILSTYLLKNRSALADVRVISFIVRIPRPWTETLSKRVLTEVQDDVGRYAADYASRVRWQNLLKKVSLSVPPQLLLRAFSIYLDA